MGMAMGTRVVTMSGDHDIMREIAVIKMARLIREVELAKAKKVAVPGQPRDGDGDMLRALYPGGPDIVPVRFLETIRSLAVQPKKIAAGKAARRAGSPKSGRMPDRVDASSFASVRKNPLFAPLFGPLPREPRKGKGSYSDFLAHWRYRILEQRAHSKFQAGGGTHFRRFVPRGHKKGQIEEPNGDYIAGGPMGLNEPGIMGEALLTLNPDIRKLVSNYFGSPIGESEGLSLQHGRVPNSMFDAYAGEYGIEIKTTSITANEKHPRTIFKLDKKGRKIQAKDAKGRPLFKDGSPVWETETVPGTGAPSYKIPDMDAKMAKAKRAGIKPAVVIMVVDQQSGRVWIFAQKDTGKVALKANQPFSDMELLTPGEGLYVGQDAMYAAWLYGSLPRPIREGGDGNSVKKVGKSVKITGRPSKTRYTSEMGNVRAQQAVDAAALGDFR